MNKFEEVARDLKNQGNNCSYSVYNAFIEKLKLSGQYPEPRTIDGKCGSLITALRILEETGNNDKIEEFEKEFVNEFGYSKCVDLMKHERRCNDYVGWSANKLSELLIEK